MPIQTIRNLAGDILYAHRHDASAAPGVALRAAVFAVAAKGYSLAGADLSGVDLSNGRLPGVNFTGACLFGVDFRNTDLTGSLFSGADARCVNFRGSILAEAKLEGAHVTAAVGIRQAMRNRR